MVTNHDQVSPPVVVAIHLVTSCFKQFKPHVLECQCNILASYMDCFILS